jgi:PAS domain S-box-containing protein
MTDTSHAHNDLQALLDAAVDAILIIDHRGVIQALNRAAEQLFGYGAEDCIGHNIRMLMPPEIGAEHDAHMSRYRATGVAHVIGRGREVEGQRRDGSRFPARRSCPSEWCMSREFWSGWTHAQLTTADNRTA